MSDQVKLKSRDGQAECECAEKYAVALVASGKWVRVETPASKHPPAERGGER